MAAALRFRDSAEGPLLVPVYVDDACIPYRGMLMSHMVADTAPELAEMASGLGLRPDWLQHAGTYREHYDVAKNTRERAIRLGAVPITRRQLAGHLMKRKEAQS